MSHDNTTDVHRILVIDDNEAIHQDFRKILHPEHLDSEASLAASEAAVFGSVDDPVARAKFQIDSAFQGEEALAMIVQAQAQDRPYAVAFIDVRMPPGWDGIETTLKIWEEDPHVQVVICTAYSDYSWQQILQKFGHSDRLIILKKPFDNIEVLQLADSLTRKWELARETEARLEELETIINERNRSARVDDIEETHGACRHRRSALALDQALREALSAGQLAVHYQPLVDVSTRRIVSLEALVRWHHEQEGEIPPTRFIDVAERTGLILPLGEFVLRSVCRQAMEWHREGLAGVPIAVNLSPVQLQRQDMRKLVREVLHETKLPAHRLTLEMTESALIRDTQKHSKTLQGLRFDGVHIEIDDFGTGYSSLSYLKYLPVDALKIDRSFVRHVDVDPTDETIVEAILTMARCLNLKVIAEGVETETQLHVLGQLGCEIAQGYYFSPALPPNECRRLLYEHNARPCFTETLRLQWGLDLEPGALDAS